MKRLPIVFGPVLNVFAHVRASAECRVKEFLDSLSAKDRAKLFKLFELMANVGRIQDGTKFKRLDGDVWEFKVRGQDTGLRVTCYRSGNLLILLSGFPKKEDEADPGEVSRAKRLMEEDRLMHSKNQQGD
ncbi:MAG: type II toxin-antitoxin system RelE/ParE family toxin [Phycisphaerales bacterium]|nr:type II toxin-antitoxin system RelE/ParE family toxin [Phycisphaerales bacterium]